MKSRNFKGFSGIFKDFKEIKISLQNLRNFQGFWVVLRDFKLFKGFVREFKKV